jgi:hypothetical protein
MSVASLTRVAPSVVIVADHRANIDNWTGAAQDDQVAVGDFMSEGPERGTSVFDSARGIIRIFAS